MLPNSNATTIAVNTRCRCKICYAILRTPVSGKSSQYYNVNSNPRSAAFTTALDQQSSSELLTTAFKEDYVEDCRYTSDMSDNSSAATATSFTDLMERFLRVSVDATAAATTLQNSSSLNSQVNTVLNSTAAAKSTAGRVSSHSEIICSKCSNILSKISELHLALQTLASNLREKYRKTLRIVGHASAASSSRQELNKCLHHHYPLGCVAVGSSSHPQPSNRSFSQPLPLCSGAYNTEQHSSDGDAADVKCTPEDVPNSYLALEDGQDDCLLAPQQSSTDDVVHSPVSWSPEGRSVQSSMIDDGKCNGTADNKLKPSIQQLSDSQMIGSRLISSSFSSRSIRHSKRKGKPRHHILFCERKLSLNETCKVRSSVSSYKTTNQQQQNSSSANNCKNHHLLHDQYTLVNSNGQYNNDGSRNQEVSSTKKRLISYDRHQHHHHQHHMLDDHPEHSGNRHELFNDDESTSLINDGNSSSQLRTMQQQINSRNNAAANRCRDFTAMSYSGACTTASDRNYSKNEYHSQHRLTQEEDEEKELQPRARNQPVCTDAKYNIQHNDNGNGRRINIDKNHTSNTRSVRKAKANNVDRIAASLMADCNSNDSMELEGNNSPISEDSPSHLHHSDSMGGVNLILDDNSQIHNEKREKCDLQGGHHLFVANECHQQSLLNNNPCAGGKSAEEETHHFSENCLITRWSNLSGVLHQRRHLSRHEHINMDSQSRLFLQVRNAAATSSSTSANTATTGTVNINNINTISIDDENQLHPPQASSHSLLEAGKDVNCQQTVATTTNSSSSVSAIVASTNNLTNLLASKKKKQCPVCMKDVNVNYLKIHLRRHFNHKPFVCKYCSKAFADSGDLQKHVRIHEEDKPYLCPICCSAYTDCSNWNTHLRTHANTSNICAICQLSLDNFSNWLAHIREHGKKHMTRESSFEIISNKRIRLPDILDHRTKSTQIYDFNQSETNDEDISLKYNQIRNSRHEELYRFGNRLDRSSKVDEDEDGEGDNVAFSSISEHDHELYPCNVLLNDSAVTFSSGSGRHRSKISGTTSIKHEYPSNHSADNVASLKAAEMNTAERNFHLDYNCSPGGGATYINEENRSIKGGCGNGDISIMSQDRTMMGHLRAVTTTTSTAAITGKNIVDHSLQQSSVGSMMPATKTQPNSPIYQSHPAQITQRNPVALTSTATSTTTSVPNTQFHSRQLGNFKRYECGYCGKIVTNIQIHVRRHTNEKPYSCEYCEKRFTNSGDLQIHTRIHTGEKPYRCPLCGKSYRTIGNFNSHVKTHDSGERPHRCILCNETFEQTRDWFSHLRSNHKLSTPVQATISSGGNSTNN
ncbi:hypothetical protein GJ496_003619 [Pomphorhynchus laevis]|nr:hypothetical protein GJ496_003619 [Pomphorhynchus laevis]